MDKSDYLRSSILFISVVLYSGSLCTVDRLHISTKEPNLTYQLHYCLPPAGSVFPFLSIYLRQTFWLISVFLYFCPGTADEDEWLFQIWGRCCQISLVNDSTHKYNGETPVGFVLRAVTHHLCALHPLLVMGSFSCGHLLMLPAPGSLFWEDPRQCGLVTPFFTWAGTHDIMPSGVALVHTQKLCGGWSPASWNTLPLECLRDGKSWAERRSNRSRSGYLDLVTERSARVTVGKKSKRSPLVVFLTETVETIRAGRGFLEA